MVYGNPIENQLNGYKAYRQFYLAPDIDFTRIKTNKEFQTSNVKYFAGGDAINGGAEVVNAAYDGKMAAQGIHNWLNK